MIIDLQKFITEERLYWSELENELDRLEAKPESRLSLRHLERFHYLYQRASADLARIATFSAEPNTRFYLESLVGRAFGQIHETRGKPYRLRPLHWFFTNFPRAFRKHIRAFWISLLAIMVGAAFGGFTVLIDSNAKQILLPFSHLQGDPSDRVKKEESADADQLRGAKTSFSFLLMTHNTRVAIDYVLAGETPFLLGWLLPHGAIEIPAILLAGQAGIVLAGALIGWGKPISLRMRLRRISNDLMTLILGVALMLVWAGIVEAFFSQYHAPVLPYAIKIGFGAFELIILVLFLGRAGRKSENINA
jgi:uncharacterized membrane protein SpoIIM required for sporulation